MNWLSPNCGCNWLLHSVEELNAGWRCHCAGLLHLLRIAYTTNMPPPPLPCATLRFDRTFQELKNWRAGYGGWYSTYHTHVQCEATCKGKNLHSYCLLWWSISLEFLMSRNLELPYLISPYGHTTTAMHDMITPPSLCDRTSNGLIFTINSISDCPVLFSATIVEENAL